MNGAILMELTEQESRNEKILHQFTELPDKWVVLAETAAEESLGNSLSMIKHLINEKEYVGIIVSASRPYKNLIKLYKQNDIDITHVLIIDCISKSQSIDQLEEENVIYQDSVSDLTNIMLSIEKAMEEISGNKFVFLDSITTMLIHNSNEIFAKFIHGLITKMRMKGVSGLLISVEEETNDHLRSQVADLCDKVIKI